MMHTARQHSGAGSGGRGRRRSGFTLVELLLVVAIVGIITAVIVPEFVRSMRGARLRNAARVVSSSGRYARSVALMNQCQVLLRFDLNPESPSVSLYKTPRTSPDDDAEFEENAIGESPAGAGAPAAAIASTAMPGTAEAGGDTNRVADLGGPELVRKLEDVQIVRVTVKGLDQDVTEGSSVVLYDSNGTCTPYTVMLRDREGGAVSIVVDNLGSAETEKKP